MIWNRPFTLLLLTNVLLGSAMPMLIILGGLAGVQLAPVKSLATLPMSIQMIAGIVVATPLSLLMGKVGRRVGFLIVAVVCVAGALIGAAAMHTAQFWALCLAHFVLGCALVGVNFIRFAASEVVEQKHKANAVSLTLASGLVAALLGPSLFEHTQQRFISAEFGGAFIAIAILAVCAMLPLLANTQLAGATNTPALKSKTSAWQTFRIAFKRPPVKIAIIVAAFSFAIMVLMMVPTPIAMVDHGHTTHHASDVIRWHVIAMFAPGLFTGSLISRFGVYPIISSGIGLLLLACVVGLTGTELTGFYLSLILLGLGWNFSFIGATNLLQSSIDDSEKSAVQGINDTVIAISSSLASVVAGVIYTGLGWVATSAMVLPMLLACVVAVVLIRRRSQGQPEM